MSANGNPVEALTAQLRALEERLLDPGVRRDRAQVAALLTEDFQEFGASGRVWTREQILDVLAREQYHAPVVEDFRSVLLAANVALVTYRAVVDAQVQTGSPAASLRSSLWVRKSGAWRLRFHQGTRSA